MKEKEKRYPKIEIKTKCGALTEVYINGHKLRGIRSWELKHNGYGTIPTLTLDLNALDLSVDGECLMMQKGYGEIGINFKEFGDFEESPEINP